MRVTTSQSIQTALLNIQLNQARVDKYSSQVSTGKLGSDLKDFATSAETLIATMEGMTFDTPKGPMTFRKEDHQALQAMYHFKIKVDPNVEWAIPELVREIKAEEMDIPIGRNNQE